MKIVEKVSQIHLKTFVFWGSFTCLTFNAVHHGTWGKVAAVQALQRMNNFHQKLPSPGSSGLPIHERNPDEIHPGRKVFLSGARLKKNLVHGPNFRGSNLVHVDQIFIGDSGFMDQFVTHEIVQNKFGPWTKSAAQINATREGKDAHTRSSLFNTIFTGFVEDSLESQSSRFQLASHVLCHAMPSLLQCPYLACFFLLSL